jgi:hypothetical protein
MDSRIYLLKLHLQAKPSEAIAGSVSPPPYIIRCFCFVNPNFSLHTDRKCFFIPPISVSCPADPFCILECYCVCCSPTSRDEFNLCSKFDGVRRAPEQRPAHLSPISHTSTCCFFPHLVFSSFPLVFFLFSLLVAAHEVGESGQTDKTREKSKKRLKD